MGDCPLTDEVLDREIMDAVECCTADDMMETWGTEIGGDFRAVARHFLAKGLAAGLVKGLERASDEAHRLSAEAWDEYDQTFSGFDDGRATALEQFALRMEDAAEAARKEGEA